MVIVRRIRSVAEIDALSSFWQKLLDSSSCHRAFSSPVWFLGYLQAYPALKPWVWVVEEEGRLTGVAPLAVHEETGQACFLDELADYQDFIVARGDTQTVNRLLRAIMDAQSEFDSLLLRGLRDNSNMVQAMNNIEAAPANLVFGNTLQPCYYIDLSTGYEAYNQKRNSGFRSNLRRAYRQAKELGIEAIELTPQDVSGKDVVDNFLRLHLMRFPDKLFSRPAPQQFCKGTLPVLFEQGKLRVFALRIGAEIVGIHLSVCDVNGLGIWNGGFDPRISSASPGKILINSQIEACCAAELSTFDFLRGEEAYKLSWSTGCQTIRQVSMD